jgi:hypothetical protein
MDFWNIVEIFFWGYVFIAYLIALYIVLGDLFRDRQLRGVFKAIWLLVLVFFPFLTVLVYLVARGRGMALRAAEREQGKQLQDDLYLAPAVSASPTQDIAAAKAMLDAGTITQAEFAALKSHAMSTAGGSPKPA